MRRIFSFIRKNILFLETIFLLAFIPLFPKVPLISITHTWVYVRPEDFVLLLVFITWVLLFLRKQVSLRTPLTLQILIFWLVGAVATIHGVLIVFPSLANVFPNVAFLSLIRHIEYLSLFFIAFHGIKDKRFLSVVSATLVLTLLGVIFYGFGQRYLGFPAYLTMNEEFAKGIPIQLSAMSRIPSTFGGQYDLAAYLVLIIPIIVSLIFGFKNLLVKLILLATSVLGLVLLVMTVSRVSLAALFLGIFIVLFFLKRKLIFIAVPVLIILGLVLLAYKPTVLSRFQGTVSEANVLVDATTGNAIGNIDFVPASFFKDKVVVKTHVTDQSQMVQAMRGESTNSASASSIILPFQLIPKEVVLVKPVNLTGEELPQGTGYTNLPLSPAVRRVDSFFYQLPPNVHSTFSAQFIVLPGRFVVKRAAAYDLSFTTRFQGEWPRAIDAFERNLLIGSGYGSVSLAVDNNYFRILAETGLLGFISFFVIFLSLGIYIKKVFPDLDSSLSKAFVIGVGAGIAGLAFNGTLIDVFEASKVAYSLWLLVGITLGILVISEKSKFSLLSELKRIAASSYAVIVYLSLSCIALFSSTLNNMFIGDDFTWFRWAANPPSNLLTYFTQADGFFYRPGTKIYFYLMYHFFWLNQVIYHSVSILLHLVVTILFFFLARRIFKGTLLPALASLFFLLMSGYSEMVFWIASTGHLFAVVFGLLAILLFLNWEEKKKVYLYVVSIISFSLALLFHEMGVIFPLLILAYKLKDAEFTAVKNMLKRKDYLLLYVPVVSYLILRFLANSHWQGGDYSYSLVKLPFNFVGNALGYIMVTFIGPPAISIYEKLRDVLNTHILLALATIPVILVLLFLGKMVLEKLEKAEKGTVYVGAGLFVISLLPFLGLGNITSRYSYVGALGLIIILVLFIKKLYTYLLTNGKEIALSVTVLFVMIYSLFHVIQLQQTSFNWAGAGVKVTQFFISIDSNYSDYWSTEPMEFHFVNVPIKYGQAWVFPVGLNDAMWFAFKNPKAKIYIDKDVDRAFSETPDSLNKKVFVFNDDGSLKEIQLSKNSQH